MLGQPDAVYIGGSFGPARAANGGEIDAINAQVGISPEFARAINHIEYDFRPFMRPGVRNFARDIIFTQLAWASGYDEIMFAWTKDDGTTPAWADHQADTFRSVGTAGITVTFPVIGYTKRELVDAALAAGMPMPFIDASHSCVVWHDGHCGECVNCVHREGALCPAAT